MRKNAVALCKSSLDFIEGMGHHCARLGIPNIGGKIFGLLILSGTSLTAEQISDTLGISRSSISTNVRRLIALGMISAEPRHNGRMEHYVLAENVWENIMIMRDNSFKSLHKAAQEALSGCHSSQKTTLSLTSMMAWTEMMVECNAGCRERWQEKVKLLKQIMK